MHAKNHAESLIAWNYRQKLFSKPLLHNTGHPNFHSKTTFAYENSREGRKFPYARPLQKYQHHTIIGTGSGLTCKVTIYLSRKALAVHRIEWVAGNMSLHCPRALLAQQMTPLYVFSGEGDGVEETFSEWHEQWELVASMCQLMEWPNAGYWCSD